MHSPSESPAPGRSKKLKTWLTRIGIAGFLFFLIKGLVWLAVFAFAGTQIFDRCN